jgi:hypothetical protein
MSILLELPLELERELSTEAERLNLPLSDYILRVLSIKAKLMRDNCVMKQYSKI